MEVFKVVNRIADTELVSSSVPYLLRHTYEIGKVTTPRIGKLFAFTSINCALNFMGRTQKILECEAEVYDDREILAIIPALSLTIEKAKKFWDDYFKEYGYLGETCLSPQGTVFCNWIKPIKIAYEEGVARYV